MPDRPLGLSFEAKIRIRGRFGAERRALPEACLRWIEGLL